MKSVCDLFCVIHFLFLKCCEGKFLTASKQILKKLRDGQQIVVRYEGDNPNGSEDDVAGICDPTGRVFGLMPHPERFVDITQHPAWTRGQVKRADGLVVFQNAAAYLKSS